jgi:thymidylate synthase (FAD)
MRQGDSSTSGLEIAQADSHAPQDLNETPPGADVVFPPHGFVHLQEAVASDLLAVNAARVSFRKITTEDRTCICGGSEGCMCMYGNGRLKESDEKVLRFLVKNRHGTPFEHTYFRFHIRAPIFVFREWHRHRIGVSINEESARYVELKDDFYIPEGDALRRQTDKPGRYKFESITDEWLLDKWGAKWKIKNPRGFEHGLNKKPMRSLDNIMSVYQDTYEQCYESYQWLIETGVAKEIARAVLPVGIYSQMIWTCNARSLMSFLSLRNADTALHEIRLMAAAMEKEFARLMPVTHDEFVKNGRKSP